MLDLPAVPSDAPEFVARVRRVVAGVCLVTRPVQLYVIHIDHWFGAEWLKFSGKSMGAIGVWKRDLTIPPFHPNRILGERLFRPVPGWTQYQLVRRPGRRLHVFQASGANLQRFTRRELKRTTCVWYSGDSATIGRGSMMVYAQATDQQWAWYADIVNEGSAWVTRRPKGISRSELAQLEQQP